MTDVSSSDERWMAAAINLSDRSRGRTAPNPSVGCVIVRNGRVLGRGWTQTGGRPHAEAMALAQLGAGVAGADVYTSLEPCAHKSSRGPSCADLLVAARPARVVAALVDPDHRTKGQGFARLRAAGILVTEGVGAVAARRAMAGFLTRERLGRPFVTLKLAMSLDGRIALRSGESRWITGPQSRAHAHLERSRHEAILVGRGTHDADQPRLDVRLPGLENRAPLRYILSRSLVQPGQSAGQGTSLAASPKEGPAGFAVLGAPDQIAALQHVDHLLIEGGASAASAFLAADLVDKILVYRAPILIGEGLPSLGDIGLTSLPDAHDRWILTDSRQLGADRLEIYERQR